MVQACRRRRVAILTAVASLLLLPPRAAFPFQEDDPSGGQADLPGEPLPVGAVARMGTVRLRHGGAVLSLAFSPDGKTLACGGLDRTVRIWDVATRKQVRGLSGHGDAVTSVAYSPDGKRLISGSRDGTARMWDLARERPSLSIRAEAGAVTAVVFSPEGARITGGLADGRIFSWSATTGSLMEVRAGPWLSGRPGADDGRKWSPCIAFSPDGRLLAAGAGDREGTDRAIGVWDRATGVKIPPVEGHEGSITCLAFSPVDRLLASGSGDGSIRLWHSSSWKEVLRIDAHPAPPPGEREWARRGVASLVFSPDGKRIASGGYDGAIRLWEAATGKGIGKSKELPGPVHAVAFSPGGKILATACGAAGGPPPDHTVRLWDAETLEPIHPPRGHTGSVSAVDVSPDGALVVTAGSDGDLRLWEGSTGREIRKIGRHGASITSVDFSPGGSRIASAGRDDTVRIWEVSSGTEILQVGPLERTILSVVFSPDGHLLAAGGEDGLVRLIDPKTVREVRRLPGHAVDEFVNSVKFSPDGRLLASASWDGTIRLWAVKTGEEIRVLRGGKEEVTSVDFTPDGSLLASAYADGTIRLWDAESGWEKMRRPGHRIWTASVAFSPDGHYVAALGSPGTVRLWEVATGQEALPMRRPDARATSVAFFPDGKRLVSGGRDSTAIVWDLSITAADLRGATGSPEVEEETTDLDVLWADLAEEDALRAYRAIWSFARSGEEGLAFLEERLPQRAVGDAERIAVISGRLDHPEEEVRKKAVTEIGRLGDLASAALREAIVDHSSREVREAAREILEGLGVRGVEYPSHFLRGSRAIQALERMGGPGATALLQTIAEESPSARAAAAARAALRRLEKGR